jgi:Kef-type K+ transport system membrane component KefB
MISQHYGILLILGVSAFVGLFGAWFFQKIKFPQVVGYIAVGLLLGQTGIGLIDEEHIESLESFTLFALGVIGFLVGGEIKISEIKKYRKQFLTILLGEGLTAFLLVGVGTGVLLYLLSGSVVAAFAGGIIIGAIASATDPASTIDVLWEYRARGIVTTSLIAIIALDDALAMTLYSIGKSISFFLVGEGSSLSQEVLSIIIGLGGAVALAVLAGYTLRYILLQTHNKDKALAISISTLFLVIGLSVSMKMDVILAAMTLGFVISNLLPRRSKELFHTARSMSIPIYVLFFVLVGARFNVSGIPLLVWGIALVYVVGRSLGKFLGTWFGAKMSSADIKVQKYTGLGLFAQGGVAIGLAIVASRNLQEILLTDTLNLGDCVIAIVTATTIAVQIMGPVMTKLAINLAGEVGKNITVEDVMSSMVLSDIIVTEEDPIKEDDTVEAIFDAFTRTEHNIKTVINNEGCLTGIISFAHLREALPDRDLWQWLLASDIMERSFETIDENSSVLEAMNSMNDTNQDALVVQSPRACPLVIGIVERNHAKKVIKQKWLKALSS